MGGYELVLSGSVGSCEHYNEPCS